MSSLNKSKKNVIINDERALIYADHFQLGCMDSKHRTQSICESCSTSTRIELIHRPFHSYHRLDCVSWYYMQSTISGNIELQYIFYTYISVFSAIFLFNCSVLINSDIPFIHIN